MKKVNPPIFGNLSKAASKDWEKIYNRSYEFYNDKKRAAMTAWSVIKKKYEKSEKSGKWILKKGYKKSKKITKKIVKDSESGYKKLKKESKKILKKARSKF